MDPFVEILTPGGQKFRTTVLQDAGKTPKWNQKIEIPGKLSDSLKLTVYDEDIMTNDLVGEITQTIEQLQQHGDKPRWFNFFYQNKVSAEIMFSGKWFPQGEQEDGYGNQQTGVRNSFLCYLYEIQAHKSSNDNFSSMVAKNQQMAG